MLQRVAICDNAVTFAQCRGETEGQVGSREPCSAVCEAACSLLVTSAVKHMDTDTQVK